MRAKLSNKLLFLCLLFTLVTGCVETRPPETPQPATPEKEKITISPTFELEEKGPILVYFGDYYRELPETCYKNDLIKPDYIVIHTDDQSGDCPENWETKRTFRGLGQTKSSHFAVSQDGILQMLPMYEDNVVYAIGTAPQWDDSGIFHDYNAMSIQIEMGGRNFNDIITGTASETMVEVIEITTEKTIGLVVELMDFYEIPIENIVGHYQIGRGKTDPGNLYFEEYFIPNLITALKKVELQGE